jgi:glycosyl transferase family 2
MIGELRHFWDLARRRLGQTGRRLSRPEPTAINYSNWIADRLWQRCGLYRHANARSRPAIDILTLVFDTDPDILRETARSVFAQEYDSYRWIVWNNGSQRRKTLAVLDELARDPRVVLRHSADNLGIVRGHAAGLRCCQGEYVGLLDHDDRLYPDALRIAGSFIQHYDEPALLYSDEDKLDVGGQPFCPFFKPAWSPALLQSTGYTCHFTLFRRRTGLQLGAFEDPGVEGAQDWDLALRFFDAGYAGVHVPEVLYSWRVHPASTAGRGTDAKPYALAGQRRCLEQSLVRRGLAGRFRVVSNPLYPFIDGHWHFERVVTDLPPLVCAASADASSFSADNDALIAVVPDGLEMLSDDWLRQAVAQFELDSDVAIVGGRVLNSDGRVMSGSPVLGMGGVVGTALAGCAAGEIGYFGLSLSPRNVAALHGGPWVARQAAVADALAGEPRFPRLVELCLRLHESGRRIVWTPHITAQARNGVAFDPAVGDDSAAADAMRHRPLIADDPFYGRYLSLESRRAYQLCRAEDRQRALAWLDELQDAAVAT